jgi:hypothetical protein
MMKRETQDKLQILRKHYLEPQITDLPGPWRDETLSEAENQHEVRPRIDQYPRIKEAIKQLDRESKRRKRQKRAAAAQEGPNPEMSTLLLLRRLQQYEAQGVVLGAAAPSVDHIIGAVSSDVEEVGDGVVDLVDSEDEAEQSVSRRPIDIDTFVMESWDVLYAGGTRIKPEPKPACGAGQGVQVKQEALMGHYASSGGAAAAAPSATAVDPQHAFVAEDDGVVLVKEVSAVDREALARSATVDLECEAPVLLNDKDRRNLATKATWSSSLGWLAEPLDVWIGLCGHPEGQRVKRTIDMDAPGHLMIELKIWVQQRKGWFPGTIEDVQLVRAHCSTALQLQASARANQLSHGDYLEVRCEKWEERRRAVVEAFEIKEAADREAALAAQQRKPASVADKENIGGSNNSWSSTRPMYTPAPIYSVECQPQQAEGEQRNVPLAEGEGGGVLVAVGAHIDIQDVLADDHWRHGCVVRVRDPDRHLFDVKFEDARMPEAVILTPGDDAWRCAQITAQDVRLDKPRPVPETSIQVPLARHCVAVLVIS